MKSVLLWTLVALNALLLIAFIGRIIPDNSAVAQVNNTNRGGAGGAYGGAGGAGGANAANGANANPNMRPGDYLMISGEVTGGNTGLVYVLDGANGLLGAMTYDDARRELAAMPAINLQRAFEAAGRAGPGMTGPGGTGRRGGTGR